MQQTSLFLPGKSMPCVGLQGLVTLDAKLVHCQKKKLAVQLRHAVENIIRYHDQSVEHYSHQAKKETAGHAATRHWTAVGHRVWHVWHGLAPLEPYMTRKCQQP